MTSDAFILEVTGGVELGRRVEFRKGPLHLEKTWQFRASDSGKPALPDVIMEPDTLDYVMSGQRCDLPLLECRVVRIRRMEIREIVYSYGA